MKKFCVSKKEIGKCMNENHTNFIYEFIIVKILKNVRILNENDSEMESY